jgi:hypothetical protein
LHLPNPEASIVESRKIIHGSHWALPSAVRARCESLPKEYLSAIIAQREVALLHFEDVDVRMVKKFTAARFEPLSCSFHHEGQQMGAPAGLHHGHGEPALASPV